MEKKPGNRFGGIKITSLRLLARPDELLILLDF